MRTPVDDITLMALADGELDAAEAEALRALILDDPDLAERFAAFVETRALLEPETAGRAEAVPPALLAGVLRAAAAEGAAAGPRLATTAPAPSPPPPVAATPIQRPAPRFALPMAAALALAVGGVIGFGVREVTISAPPFAVAEAPASLLPTLDTAPTGARRALDGDGLPGAALTVVATYPMEDGGVCREVAITRPAMIETRVLCRAGAGWRTQLVVVDPAGPGFRPATGQHEAVERFLEGRGAGAAVTGPAEAALLQRRR